jgi:hypothetical protein
MPKTKKFETLVAHWPAERRARIAEMVRRDLEEIDRQLREEPALAAESLKNGVESGDPDALLMALRKVAEAHVEKLDHYHREALERALRQANAGEEADRGEVMKVVEQLIALKK